MLLRLFATVCVIAAAALAQLVEQNELPYFGDDTPEDGSMFYSFPGTRFELPAIHAFDDNLNGTANGLILTATDDFLDSTTQAGISTESGFNPYILSSFKWSAEPATVSMRQVEEWTNRTQITYSFIDYSVDHFRLVPDPYRQVCFILKDNSVQAPNAPPTLWNQRCYRIYVQVAPQFSQGCNFGTTTVPTQPATLTAFVDSCPRLPMQAKTVIAVGQNFVGHIYFEDYNRDGTDACTDCDQVVISVMADPGLPNGASLRNTVGGNADTQSPAEYTNLMAVRYRDRGSSAVNSHLFSRRLTFTPAEEQSVTYRICVEAVDVMSAAKQAVSNGLRTNATKQCLELQVALPDTRLLPAPAFAPHPPLPLGPLHDPPEFAATVRCDHRFSVVLYEGRELEEEAVQSDARAGFEQDVYVPAATPDPAHPLPPGAAIGPVERVAVCPDLSVDCAESARRLRVSHQVLSWTPQRGMEGQAWTACLLLRDQTLSAGAGEQRVCTRFRVNKCEVCTRHGDTLLSIASDFATDWLQLWGANPDIANPYDLHEVVEEQDNRLVLGPVATLPVDEAAVAVASRFRMSHKTLQLLNPELPADAAVIPAGVHVCIIPNICLQAGDINAV